MRVDHCFRWNYNFTSFTHWFSFQSLSIIGFKFPGFPVLDFEMLNGIFRINFHGPKNWNAIDESLNSSCLAVFKKTLTNLFIDRCYLFLFHVHATFFWKCVCVCVCVCARVCVCVCACVCALRTHSNITNLLYSYWGCMYNQDKPLWAFQTSCTLLNFSFYY